MRYCFLLVAFVVGSFSVGISVGQAQDKGPAYVVTYIEVAPSGRASARNLLHKLGEASRKQTGNVGFEILRRVDRPQHFVILEAWKDAKAQADHAAASDTKKFRDDLKPFLVAPYDERPHFGFLTAAAKKREARSLYAVTHVDFVGVKKDEGLAAAKRLGDAAGKETGVERFDILQQSNRPNHITLVEMWRGKLALEAHEGAESTRKFREELQPIGGALYDQRLFRAID